MRLARLFSDRSPSLDWIQLEVTSHCNASCIYCPQCAYGDNWQRRHIPMNVIRNLVPSFKKARLVFLQGWGEPFLHPAFFEIVRIAKGAGCAVGTNTNGTILGPDVTERLVEEGIDILAFSLAAARKEKNDVIRRGTSLMKVRQAIEAVQAFREKKKLDRPKIHIAYMLLHSGLEDTEYLPEFFADLGAEQVVVSSLALAVQREMEKETHLTTTEKGLDLLKTRLLDIRGRAAARGVQMSFQIAPSPKPRRACSENIERSVFIGADGRVHPCVFAGIPVRGDNFFYTRGKEHPLRSLSFGNVKTTPLGTIWRSKKHRAFRRQFGKSALWPGCVPCFKRRLESLELTPELVP